MFKSIFGWDQISEMDHHLYGCYIESICGCYAILCPTSFSSVKIWTPPIIMHNDPAETREVPLPCFVRKLKSFYTQDLTIALLSAILKLKNHVSQFFQLLSAVPYPQLISGQAFASSSGDFEMQLGVLIEL